MPTAPDHPQLLITARVSMLRLRLLPWHHAHSPLGAHGPPAPPASPLFCKPLRKTGGLTGTGWHRVGTQHLDSPHPTRRPTGAQVPGWGASLATFPSPLSLGMPRVVPHSMGAPPVLPLPCPPTQPGEEGSGGSQPSTPAGFGGVLAPQGLLLILLQPGQGGGTRRPPQFVQLLAVRLQYQLRQPCEGLWERGGVNLGDPSSTPRPLQAPQANPSPLRNQYPSPLSPPGPSYLLDVEVAAGTGLVEIHPVFPGQLWHQGFGGEGG